MGKGGSLVLAGKVAAITGGSSGVGLAIARMFARAGASVAVLSRHQEGVDRVAAELSAQVVEEGQGQQEKNTTQQTQHSSDSSAAITKQRGAVAGMHRGIVCDVRDAASIKNAFQMVRGQLGPVDILVNAAGVCHDGLLLGMDEGHIDSMLETNLRGSLLTCHAAYKQLLTKRGDVAAEWIPGRGGGGGGGGGGSVGSCIINIGSVVGHTGAKGQSVYAASKAGLVGLTKSLAKELGSRAVRVNCIEPGFIANTSMTDILNAEQKQAILARIPMRRFATVEEIASLALFLASPAASYITGQVIRVDGGLGD